MGKSSWKRAGVMVLGAGLFVASAYAAKECDDFEQDFPGVDGMGLLSNEPMFQGELQCHICANTKNGKFRKKCEGAVVNESGEKHKYKDDPIFTGNGKRPIFIVKENGDAKFRESGVLDEG